MNKRIFFTAILLTLLLAVVPTFADEQISFSEESISLYENEQALLTLNVSSGLKNADITYKSGDTSVVKVNGNGQITAVSKGNAVITATVKTAKQTYKATIKVTVLRAVTSIEINENALKVLTEADGVPFILAQNLFSDSLPEDKYETGMTLERIIILASGKNIQLQPTLKPASASDRSSLILSSDKNVVTVQKQTLSGNEEGASIITVASVSNPEVYIQYGVLVVNPITKLTVDTVKTTIGAGGTAQMNIDFTPEDATFRAVQWVSDNPKVATVDDNGLVTGISKGKAVIRATALDGSNRSDSVTINVQMMPTSIEISGSKEISLAAGKSTALKANVNPNSANNRNVTWNSTDPGIAKVNQEGRVTAVALGSCDIIATSDADPDLSDYVHVSVIQEVTSINFAEKSLEMSVGTSAFVQAAVTPNNASNPVLTYSVDNSKIATIDEFGTIKALSKGNTTIRAKATDGSGKSASMSLTVVQLPESITLDKTSVTINTGKSTTIRATVLPKTTNNTRVTWESTDTSVAKVNISGQITAVKAGTCQIICQAAADPSVSAIVDVTVHQLVTKITPQERTLSVNVKETVHIFWTVEPSDATDPGVTFTSNKPTIATVDQDGTVHGIKRGECIITIKSEDGSNKQATVRINVLQPVEGVYMKENNYQVDVEKTVRLTAQLIPSDASNTNMIWHSMDETIATVSGKNTRPTVTGRRWGTVEITGYTEDGGYSASTWVTVQNYDTAVRPTDLYLSNNEIKLTLVNVSNLQITRVEFTLECYDIYNVPLCCNIDGSNFFDGIYKYTLGEGESTRHGRFNFIDYLQPSEQIGRVVLTITSYRVQEGWRYDIPVNKQTSIEYVSPNYIGNLPTPEPGFDDSFIVEDDTQPEPVG